MNDTYFSERRRALEESFFAKVNKDLLEKFQKKMDANELAEVCGLADAAMATHLVELGIQRETICALVLVPLIQVAWADRKLDPNEKEAVMKAVAERGLAPDSPALRLVESWLSEPPEAALFEAWQGYVALLLQRMQPAERAAFKEHLFQQAEAVAKSAGGVLGFGRISPGEQVVLDRIKAL